MTGTLTENQKRFFAMLEEFPKIAVYWDKPTASLQRDILEQDLTILSSGESALVRFFASVWEGNNHFEFDIIQHIPDCDSCTQQMIAAWIVNPFFP